MVRAVPGPPPCAGPGRGSHATAKGLPGLGRAVAPPTPPPGPRAPRDANHHPRRALGPAGAFWAKTSGRAEEAAFRCRRRRCAGRLPEGSRVPARPRTVVGRGSAPDGSRGRAQATKSPLALPASTGAAEWPVGSSGKCQSDQVTQFWSPVPSAGPCPRLAPGSRGLVLGHLWPGHKPAARPAPHGVWNRRDYGSCLGAICLHRVAVVPRDSGAVDKTMLAWAGRSLSDQRAVS